MTGNASPPSVKYSQSCIECIQRLCIWVRGVLRDGVAVLAHVYDGEVHCCRFHVLMGYGSLPHRSSNYK